MSSLLSSYLPKNVIQRYFEEISEKAINNGIAVGDDGNNLARRVLKATFDKHSPLVAAARAIPGLRYAPHLVLGAVSELLNDQALNLWPGDNRPAIRALRMVLKNTAPALLGIGAATADVLEHQVDEAVGKVISPSAMAPADRKAALDLVMVIPKSHFGMRPFFPVITDAEGKIVLTEQGAPKVLDREFINFAAHWIQDHPKTRIKIDGGRNGQGQTTQEIAPTAPWQPYSFQEWLTLVDSTDEIGTDVVEALRKQFAPSKSWDHQLSEETWAVFRAVICTQRDLFNKGARKLLDGKDFESLIKTMLKAQPPSVRVNKMIGDAFFDRIGKEEADPTHLSEMALTDFEHTLDFFLGGEQNRLDTIIRTACLWRQSAAKNKISLWKAILMIAAVTSVIWLPILLGSVLLGLSAFLAYEGIVSPLKGVVTWKCLWWSSQYPAKLYALFTLELSGWLAFAVTWFFPVFQTAMSWIRYVFPSLKEDWLKSIGRKIITFGLLVFSGMEFYAVALNVSSLMRAVILASCGVGIALSIMLVEAGYRAEAERAVKNSYKPLLLLFVILPLVIAFVYGAYDGNSGPGTMLPHGLDGVWEYLQASKMVQSILFLLLVGGLGVHLLTHATVKDHATGSWWIVVLAILGLSIIWLNESPKKDPPTKDLTHEKSRDDKERVKQQASEVNVTPLPHRSAPPVPVVPAISNKQLCDTNQIPYKICQSYGYK